MLTLLAVSGMRVWHPVSIRLKENAFCLFFTPTPFPLVKWMKLTPRLYCLRPRKVNGTARAETDKCPCDAVQGNQATKAAREEGWALQRARLELAQGWVQAQAPTGQHDTGAVWCWHCPITASWGLCSIFQTLLITCVYVCTCSLGGIVPVFRKQIG